MSDWSSYRISNIGKVVTGNTPSKNNPNDFGFEMPFITPSDYGNYRKYANSSIRYLSIDGIERLNNKIIPKKSILVTCIGSDMGKVVMNKKDIITNQQINSIIPNNDIVNSDYLYYLIKNSHEYLQLLGSDGTAVPIVNKSTFENIEINLPPLPEQKAIASVLSSLDDKIDLLHRQNETLEKMAETLFRKWFVEDTKEDWKYTSLEKYVSIFNGVSYKSIELNPSKTAMITLKSFSRNGGFRLDGFKEFTGKFKEQHIVKEGDLVVAHTDITQDAALIGNPVLVISRPEYETLLISMDLVKVESNFEWLSKEFLYFLMRTREFKEHCIGFSNGSTVLHLSKAAIPSFEFFLPSIELINKFTTIVQPMILKMNKNISHVRNLERQRDNLLPKLMSGEVRVKLN